MPDQELFNVVQFFPGGQYEYVLRNVPAKEAMERAKSLTESVGGRMGFIERVILTDMGDCTCFVWEKGKGVTFPPPEPKLRDIEARESINDMLRDQGKIT